MLQLRRIISSESWVPEIDGLRFIAIAAVLLFHVKGEILLRGPQPVAIPEFLGFVLNNGDRGVALFFVISGFVLARPFYHQHRLGGRAVKLPFYFMRRLTRLEPPFLLSLLIYFIAFVTVMHAPVRDMLHHTLLSAAYVHNFAYPGDLPTPNYVTWSLEVEIQFYILAPLIGQIYRIPNTGLRRAVWALLTVGGCFFSTFHTGKYVSLLTYAGFFPAGFLLADIFDDPKHKKSLGEGESYLWDFVGLAGWITLFVLPTTTTIRCFLPILIVPVYLTAFHGKVSRAMFRLPLLTTIGGMCYSLYLTHPLVMAMAFRVAKRFRYANGLLTLGVEGIILLAAIIPVGIAYFVLVERPCMNKYWPQELLGRFRGAKSAA